ncbi:MAG: histidinol dehydrogenase [Planctomycetota bacterium]|nr:MAG: histidinol dehydrogenase [Planctomycetota bacterium]
MTPSDAGPCARIDLAQPNGRARLDALRGKLVSHGDMISPAGRQKTIDVFGEPLSPRLVVERICADVAATGLDAVLDYTLRIDGIAIPRGDLFVTPQALAAAHRSVESGFLESVRRIGANVERFQRAILASDVSVPLAGGGSLRQRYVPLDRVGVCVPGGAAAYPSTLLMTVVPAQVAGVGEIVVVAPPTKYGSENRHVLATCHELGITKVLRCGGAQGVAALAHGLPAKEGFEGLARVDKIVGPGNLFVALAKQHVFGRVSIDSIAGPSEIVIVADAHGRPEFIAADMLAQAEHSPGSAILLTASLAVADAVAEALLRRLAVLERSDLTRDSLERFCGIVVTHDDAESARLADEIAPEHLSIDTVDPEATLATIRHAGAAFLGPWSPVAAGDYAAGPSHVLPTGGTARFAAGLSANEFLRGGSVIHLAEEDLRGMAADIAVVADIEGLTAHRRSVEVRSGKA